ncbi:MAG: PAS domain S-box protein [Clostridia bacterium]
MCILDKYRHLLGSENDILISLNNDYLVKDVIEAQSKQFRLLKDSYIGEPLDKLLNGINIEIIIDEIELGKEKEYRKNIFLSPTNKTNHDFLKIEIIYDKDIILVVSSNKDLLHQNCSCFYKEIFDASTNGLLILNLNAEIVKANQAFASIIGSTKDNLIGRKLIKFVHPDDHNKLYQISDLFLAGNKIIQYEVKIRTINLGYRVFELNGFLRGDFMYFLVRDISDKKALNEMLLSSKLNYQNMFNSMEDFIVIAYLDGQIIYSNSAYYKKLGYTAADLRAKSLYDLHPKSYQSEVKSIIDEIKEGKRDESLVPLVSKCGREWPVETKVWFGQWNGEDVLYALSKDLSKEQELLVRFNKVFQTNPSYMTIHDYKSEEIIEVNQAFLDKFYLKKEDIIGKKISELGFKGLISINSLKDFIEDFDEQVQRRYYYNNERVDVLHSVEHVESITEEYILSVMIDITELNSVKEELEQISLIQDILMKLSTDFINISLEEVNSAINSSLALMGKFIHADRVYIFDYDFDKGLTNNTHEWCSKYASEQIHNLQGLPIKPFKTWVETHRNGDIVHIEDVSKLNDGDPIKEVLQAQNIKSVLAAPMILNGECIGFTGFDTTMDYRAYSESEVRLMNLFAQMIANVLNRKHQEDLLYSKIKEREILINEIHHRVKNNLQIISSFLYLQSQYSNDEKIKQILNTTNNRIKAMAILHEKIYRGDSLNRFSFKSYLEEINRQLFNHYLQNDKLKLDLKIEDIDISLNRAIPIGLIVNELVTNAVQHAFVDKEDGKLTVEVYTEEDSIIIVIKDDGVGYDTDKNNREESLGLVIVDSLIAQLDGTYEVNANNGTTYYIELPNQKL